MTVERLRVELPEQRSRLGHIAPEAQKILEAQSQVLFVGQQVGLGDSRYLVPERPHRIEAERLVARRVREQILVRAVRIADVVVHAVEQQPRHDVTR